MNYVGSDSKARLINGLGSLSQNIVNNHHRQNAAQFALHDMCSTSMLNLDKVAYLVNNPDFKALKGVAGYQHSQAFKQGSLWLMPEQFCQHLEQHGTFHNHVRTIEDKAINVQEKKELLKLADRLEIEDPMFHVWDMKYDNQGIILFTKPDHEEHNQLRNVAPLLSFCSVF